MPARGPIQSVIAGLAGMVVVVFTVLQALRATPAIAAPATGLSATERRIAAAVERHQPRSLALLERAVNINSGTMNFEGVRAVAGLFQPEFEAL